MNKDGPSGLSQMLSKELFNTHFAKSHNDFYASACARAHTHSCSRATSDQKKKGNGSTDVRIMSLRRG